MAPAGTQNDAHIPVVDLSSPTAANELLNAACEHGFIFVKHTADVGLAPQDVDEMFDIVCCLLFVCVSVVHIALWMHLRTRARSVGPVGLGWHIALYTRFFFSFFFSWGCCVSLTIGVVVVSRFFPEPDGGQGKLFDSLLGVGQEPWMAGSWDGDVESGGAKGISSLY